MEIIGLTQSLRKSATQPAQEVIDYLEASANVPSAALLGTFKQSTSSIPAPIPKPLLFPPSVSTPSTPAMSSPARRRRRNLYTGAGQSPRASSTPRTIQTQPSRLRLQPTSNDPTVTSNKKRLVGDGAIPMSSGSGSASQTSGTSVGNSDLGYIPFPAQSPIRPQTSQPPSRAGPSSRPTMSSALNIGKGLPFSAPTKPTTIVPRQPSPLRKSNLDLSMISNDSDQEDELRPATKKADGPLRSETSATILDIIMDEANPLPPVKQRAAPELKNPFEDMHPSPKRTSTPVRRVASLSTYLIRHTMADTAL
ncbi:hypothetical protein DL93DRAFT_591754 [Clavulina sp. PMI_390]|nr:hypothetical protein DL93DRAFT_591754 [Clavulina sp. PMI_390]